MIIRVTNGNEFTFTDLYDGIPYTFPAGESVKVPIEAAAHFFGFPSAVNEETNESKLVPIADFRHVARRYGWDTPPATRNKDERPDFAAQLAIAQVWFEKLKIEPRREVVTDEAVDEDTLPAPRESALGGVTVSDETPPEPRQARKYVRRSGRKVSSALVSANAAKARAARKAKREEEAVRDNDIINRTLDEAAAGLPAPVSPSWPVITGDEPPAGGDTA